MSNWAIVRDRFGLTREQGMVRCPCHEDATSSLSVKRDGDDVLVNCFAGCDWKVVRDALELESRVKRVAPTMAPVHSPVVAEYHYVNATGEVVAMKQRLEPKRFRWRVVGPGGEWGNHFPPGQSQADLPLYGLPFALEAAERGDTVFVVEGEKDVMNLRAVGVAAVCNPEGASGAASSCSPHRWDAFPKGTTFAVIPDNDPPGEQHALRIVAALKSRFKAHVLRLSGLPEKGDVSDWLANGGTADGLRALASMAPLPVVVPDGAELADRVFQAIRRFVVLSDEAAVALSLWTMHCHAFEASAGFTPYIWISSPSRESGKTTLIDVLEAMVPSPLRADSASGAAIYRAVDCGRGVGTARGRPPVLFLDELDTIFKHGVAQGEKAEHVRGILNSGFKATGRILIAEPSKDGSYEPRHFVTYCPKVLAGIGQLPDTVTSRSIPVPLLRATREQLANIRPARAATLKRELTDVLGVELAAWASDAIPQLQEREEPVLGLKARCDDIWAPLLAIADGIGGGWPERARQAARFLHADRHDDTDGRDPGIALLSDLRDLFVSEGGAYITSARLAELLRQMETRPWPEYSRGGSITTHAIARLLRPFGIAPRQERVGYEKVRAYWGVDCDRAFAAYLPPLPPRGNGTTEAIEAFPSETRRPTLQPGVSPTGTVPLVPLVPIPPRVGVPSPNLWAPDPDGLEPLPF